MGDVLQARRTRLRRASAALATLLAIALHPIDPCAYELRAIGISDPDTTRMEAVLRQSAAVSPPPSPGPSAEVPHE